MFALSLPGKMYLPCVIYIYSLGPAVLPILDTLALTPTQPKLPAASPSARALSRSRKAGQAQGLRPQAFSYLRMSS